MSDQQLDNAVWRKSSRSQSGLNNCVEVADGGSWAALRDSKDPAGPVLVVSATAFATFVRRATTP